jgi:hypothetical protein
MNLNQNNFQLTSLKKEIKNAPKIHSTEAKHRREKTVLILL